MIKTGKTRNQWNPEYKIPKYSMCLKLIKYCDAGGSNTININDGSVKGGKSWQRILVYKMIIYSMKLKVKIRPTVLWGKCREPSLMCSQNTIFQI